MASVIEIVNRALSRLNEERITALTDTDKRAEACDSAWEIVRDEVLAAHPWNGIQARAQLAADATAPIWDFERSFTWPADALRIVGVDTTLDWVCEGRKILTDAVAPLYVTYCKRETDPTKYSPLLVSLLAQRLAAEIAFELKGSTAIQEAMELRYARMLGQAKQVDAVQGSPREIITSSWIDARF